MSNRLTQRDPLLAELDAMTEGFDRMFGVRPAAGGPRGFLPAADVYETEGEVVIELDAPGVHPENLSAEVIDGQLVVSGERASAEGAVRRYRSERWQGRFGHSEAWTRAVRTALERLDAAFAEQRSSYEDPMGLMAQIANDDPRLRTWVRQLRHRWVELEATA